MKTFEDCLDDIAVRYNYRDWGQFLTDCADTFKNPTDEIFKAIKKAALLYGEAKWKEACNLQKMECDMYNQQNGIMLNVTLAPIPPFKP